MHITRQFMAILLCGCLAWNETAQAAPIFSPKYFSVISDQNNSLFQEEAIVQSALFHLHCLTPFQAAVAIGLITTGITAAMTGHHEILSAGIGALFAIAAPHELSLSAVENYTAGLTNRIHREINQSIDEVQTYGERRPVDLEEDILKSYPEGGIKSARTLALTAIIAGAAALMGEHLAPALQSAHNMITHLVGHHDLLRAGAFGGAWYLKIKRLIRGGFEKRTEAPLEPLSSAPDPIEERITAVEMPTDLQMSPESRERLKLALSTTSNRMKPRNSLRAVGRSVINWALIELAIMNDKGGMSIKEITALLKREPRNRDRSSKVWGNQIKSAASLARLPIYDYALIYLGLLTMDNQMQLALTLVQPYFEKMRPANSRTTSRARGSSKQSPPYQAHYKHALSQIERWLAPHLPPDAGLEQLIPRSRRWSDDRRVLVMDLRSALWADSVFCLLVTREIIRQQFETMDAETNLTYRDELISNDTLSSIVEGPLHREGFVYFPEFDTFNFHGEEVAVWERATLIETLQLAVYAANGGVIEHKGFDALENMMVPLLQSPDVMKGLTPQAQRIVDRWAAHLQEQGRLQRPYETLTASEMGIIWNLRQLEQEATKAGLQNLEDPDPWTLKIMAALDRNVPMLPEKLQNDAIDRLTNVLAAMATFTDDGVSPIVFRERTSLSFRWQLHFFDLSLSRYGHAAGVGRILMNQTRVRPRWYTEAPWAGILQQANPVSLGALVNWLLHERTHLQEAMDRLPEGSPELQALQMTARDQENIIRTIAGLRPDIAAQLQAEIHRLEHHEESGHGHRIHPWLLQLARRLLQPTTFLLLPILLFFMARQSGHVDAARNTQTIKPPVAELRSA